MRTQGYFLNLRTVWVLVLVEVIFVSRGGIGIVVSSELTVDCRLVRNLDRHSNERLIRAAQSNDTVTRVEVFVSFAAVVGVVSEMVNYGIRPFGQDRDRVDVSDLVGARRFALVRLYFDCHVASVVQRTDSFVVVGVFAQVDDYLAVDVRVDANFRVVFVGKVCEDRNAGGANGIAV